MLRPRACRARWFRPASLLALGAALAVLTACVPQFGVPTAGTSEAATDDGSEGVRPGVVPGGGGASASESSDGLIPSAELGAVYQRIVQSYIRPVDHAALVESAVIAVHQAGVDERVLPLDLAAVDLVAAPAGDPARDWVAFVRNYDLLVAKQPEWAAKARPDRAILRSMLATLRDDSATFIDASDRERDGETRVSGVGIRLSRQAPADPPHVSDLFRNSPASSAGLKLGDQILAVDGTSTDGLSTTKVASLVRGQRGGAVVLSIARGEGPPVDIRVSRGSYEAARVEAGVRPDGFAVLRIRSFGEGDGALIQQWFVAGRNRGIRGWVLDLRGNTGGDVEVMAQVASIFVEGRPVAFAIDRNGDRQPLMAPGGSGIGRFPFALVVDRGTSSWAEVFAASIQDYEVGPVVGVRTAGNVGVATQQLSDGSAFQLAILRMQTPSGAPIDRQGVQPDFEVVTTVPDLQAGDDPPVERAVELLMNIQVPRQVAQSQAAELLMDVPAPRQFAP